MKRSLFFILAALFCIVLSVDAQSVRKASRTVAPKTIVEVLYFHGKQRCPTCMAIEKYAKEVISKDFAAQCKRGQVRYKEVDISTSQGEKIADKYHVTWSSLYVNQWKNGKESRNDLTRFAFENARSNTSAFKSELKNRINKLLK